MVLFEETLFWSTQVLIRPTFQDVLVSLVCSCFFPFLTVCWNAKTGYQKKTHIKVKITTWATQSVHVSFFFHDICFMFGFLQFCYLHL